MRNEEYTVKSTGSNSTLKLFLIQSIDRKLPYPTLLLPKGMSMDALLSEAETIVTLEPNLILIIGWMKYSMRINKKNFMNIF